MPISSRGGHVCLYSEEGDKAIMNHPSRMNLPGRLQQHLASKKYHKPSWVNRRKGVTLSQNRATKKAYEAVLDVAKAFFEEDKLKWRDVSTAEWNKIQARKRKAQNGPHIPLKPGEKMRWIDIKECLSAANMFLDEAPRINFIGPRSRKTTTGASMASDSREIGVPKDYFLWRDYTRGQKRPRNYWSWSKSNAAEASRKKVYKEAAYEFLDEALPGAGTLGKNTSTNRAFPQRRADGRILNRRGIPERTNNPGTANVGRLGEEDAPPKKRKWLKRAAIGAGVAAAAAGGVYAGRKPIGRAIHGWAKTRRQNLSNNQFVDLHKTRVQLKHRLDKTAHLLGGRTFDAYKPGNVPKDIGRSLGRKARILSKVQKFGKWVAGGNIKEAAYEFLDEAVSLRSRDAIRSAFRSGTERKKHAIPGMFGSEEARRTSRFGVRTKGLNMLHNRVESSKLKRERPPSALLGGHTVHDIVHNKRAYRIQRKLGKLPKGVGWVD